MKLRHMKDALKGQAARLARAEALLRAAAPFMEQVEWCGDSNTIEDALCIQEKIEQFLRTPIDTGADVPSVKASKRN